MDTDISMSLDERKLLFKSRTDDIDIHGNFKWKQEIFTCISWKEKIPENKEYLVCFPILIG